MKDIRKNYITVQGWMVQDFNLKSNEVLVFSLIFGFCQDQESEFTGSLKYICTWLNCSKPTAIKALKSLMEKELILKTEKIVNHITYNHYKINFTKISKETLPGGKETLPGGKETLPGGKETLPGGKETLPGSKETLPGGSKETLPGGSKETLPYINNINKHNINTNNNKDKNIYRAFNHLSISFLEFKKLEETGYTKEEIDDTLDQVENYKKNKNYSSLYLTCKSWLKRDKEKSSAFQNSAGSPVSKVASMQQKMNNVNEMLKNINLDESMNNEPDPFAPK